MEPSLAQKYLQPQTSSSYIVKKGDTLWGIAQKMLGSGTKWQQLQGYSGDPRKLPIGTKITAPIQQTAKPVLSTTTPLQKAIAQTTPVKNPYTFGTSPTTWANNVLKTANKTPAVSQAYTPNILGNNSAYKVPTIPGMINLGSYIR
jgi:LysM repeat protein